VSADGLVLVTGATGAVGPAVVARLLADGRRVRVFSRHARARPDGDGARVETVAGDVSDPAAVARAVEGAGQVLHLAGLLHVQPAPPSLAAEYERVNHDGARVVVDACVRAGVRRLVHLSTIAVYGATGPDGADEDTPPRPATDYAASKLRGEQAALARHGDGGLGVCVLRLAAVYGPHVKGNYARLARSIARGRFVAIGPGRNRRTLVHEADAAAAAVLAASHPAAAGRVYNVTDGCLHRLSEILEAIAAAAGRRPPPVRVPMLAARAAAAVADGALGLAGRGPRVGPMLEKYGEEVVVHGERVRRELGFHPRFDLAAGWRDALADREHA
jgi:nucleoside-diphosphate-sugar epimerase